MESEEVSGGNAAVVNFYTELGLDRTWAVDQLQAKLQKLKLHWGRRASLAGKHGDEARERLSVIESALNTFSDEDAKERYDYRLRHADSVVSDDEVNWVARAWTYYFAEDYDAAVVAARKARERGSSDPAAYVVSAWIELAQYHAERALEYASEAYVLDENGDNAFEVQEVRGVVFYATKKYDRAIEAFKKAADTASSTQKPEVCLRLARAQTQRSRHKEALLSCLAGLQEGNDGQMEDKLVQHACKSMKKTGWYSSSSKETPRQQAKSLRDLIEGFSLSQSVKQRLINYLEVLITREDKVRELSYIEARMKEPKMEGSDPDFPLFTFIFLGPIAVGFILSVLIALFEGRPIIGSSDTGRQLFGILLIWSIIVFLRFCVYFSKKSEYADVKRKYQDEVAEYEANEKCVADLQSEIKRLDNK